MLRPNTLMAQYLGKAAAEVYRGSGVWPLQPHPCDLEPPWDRFDRSTLSLWECMFNGWEAPWEGNLIRRAIGVDRLHDQSRAVVLPPREWPDGSDLAVVAFEQYPEDESTVAKGEELLRSLTCLSRPVAFELVGIGTTPRFDHEQAAAIIRARAAGEKRDLSEAICGWTEPYIRAQFVAHKSDAPRIERLLLAHYPNSAVVRADDLSGDAVSLSIGSDIRSGDGWGVTLSLGQGYCFPLRTFSRFDPDPLGVAVAAMDDLGRNEWALVQVLLQPAGHAWAATLREAVVDPYRREFLDESLSERLLKEKFSSPLFACTIRIASRREDVFRQLTGWAQQYAAPPQEFEFQADDEASNFGWAVETRCTFRPGLLLNTHELSGLVHLPSGSVSSERLRKVKSRTRAAAETGALAGSVLLGENVHRGKVRKARLPLEHRLNHCYIAGATGTGKSTLLLNMIAQDIAAGSGVGVLDPHGDLITEVMRRIPEERVEDVILFDPTDSQFPFALNILDARKDQEGEEERLVADMLTALSRYFPDSWGPRLERILTFTLYTVLEAIPNATLDDVERLLTVTSFRQDLVARVRTPRYATFWNHEFAQMAKNAVDPVLNKLTVFLLNRTVRNIICQRRCAIDFDDLINGRKILLANLSTGLLTERISGMLGNFLVSKLVSAAFRRARLPQEQREPWFLYLDEFQSFMNLSMGFERILPEARKFRLVLAGMANQYVGQLSSPVRQAIFGNVGTMIAFRLGLDDANLVSREMGAFTAEDIFNLQRGQALVRPGSAAHVFNLQTCPPPAEADDDPTARIKALARQRYARPRTDVEAELTEPIESADGEPPSPSAKPHSRRRGRRKGPSSPPPLEPRDPNEDDLVT